MRVSERKLPLVVIDVGHSERDKGAVSPYPPFTTEWDYNSGLAIAIQNQVWRARTSVVFREPVGDGYQRLPGRINALEPDFILSLHCNAANPAAYGTEMIHYPGSDPGKEFAGILQRAVSSVFGWSEGGEGYRGIKTPVDGRGWSFLENTKAPCVIAEPFFLTNEADHRRGIELVEELSVAYAAAIDEFAGIQRDGR